MNLLGSEEGEAGEQKLSDFDKIISSERCGVASPLNNYYDLLQHKNICWATFYPGPIPCATLFCLENHVGPGYAALLHRSETLAK